LYPSPFRYYRAVTLEDAVVRPADAGAEIVAGTPEALARLLKEDQVKWGRLIRKKKITVD
jgi:hypothetical protein